MTAGQQRLRKILDTYAISSTSLARAAGLSHTTVTRFVGNPARGTMPRGTGLEGETVLRIHEALSRLGVPASIAAQFLEACGHRELLERVHRQPPDPIDDSSEAPSATGALPGESIDHLLATSIRLNQQGHREEALALARRAQDLAQGDPERWADITLRYCAHYQQQMGKVDRALADVFLVKRRYLSVVERPQPGIQALWLAQRGWAEDQQHGNFAAAHALFSQALRLAEEAGDR